MLMMVGNLTWLYSDGGHGDVLERFLCCDNLPAQVWMTTVQAGCPADQPVEASA